LNNSVFSNKMNKRGFVNFTILYIFIISSIIIIASSSVLLDYLKKREISHYQIEANSFINSEQNNVINYCLSLVPLNNFTYYKDFNYDQKIKFILSCKLTIDKTNGIFYISYNLKGCREKDYIKTGTYPICLEKQGKINLSETLIKGLF